LPLFSTTRDDNAYRYRSSEDSPVVINFFFLLSFRFSLVIGRPLGSDGFLMKYVTNSICKIRVRFSSASVYDCRGHVDIFLFDFSTAPVHPFDRESPPRDVPPSHQFLSL
jgi:hypothetical protein